MSSLNLVTVIAPLAIIALAIPLILEKVPRNRYYGFRTPFTMSSDPIWYRANKIAGITLVAAGIRRASGGMDWRGWNYGRMRDSVLANVSGVDFIRASHSDAV